MNMTITGYSTALFATWFFIEEHGLLFDAGDGVSAALLQKSRKIRHVFISHADRDHLTGLLQLNQLNAREGYPVIHYPKDSGSFPALERFSKAFDPNVSQTIWKPITAGDRVFVKPDLYIEAIRNGHVASQGITTRSLSYKLIQTRRKLKPDFSHLSGPDIRRLTIEQGREAVTDEVHTCLLGYSGDTPVEDRDRWNDCAVLIHEATFLGGDADTDLEAHGNRHSRLDEVLEMAAGSGS
jgi:ribonuclease Z